MKALAGGGDAGEVRAPSDGSRPGGGASGRSRGEGAMVGGVNGMRGSDPGPSDGPVAAPSPFSAGGGASGISRGCSASGGGGACGPREVPGRNGSSGTNGAGRPVGARSAVPDRIGRGASGMKGALPPEDSCGETSFSAGRALGDDEGTGGGAGFRTRHSGSASADAPGGSSESLSFRPVKGESSVVGSPLRGGDVWRLSPGVG